MKPGDLVSITKMMDDEGIVPGSKVTGILLSIRTSRWSPDRKWQWCMLLENDGVPREHMFDSNSIEVLQPHEGYAQK